MKEFFYENGLLLGGITVSLIASVLFQVVIAYAVIMLVKESQTLEEGNTKWLRKWKEDYLKNEKEITNIQVFVERHIHEFRMGKFSIIQMKHISGQLLLFAIFLSGVGVCKEIINGKTLGEILPFYIICLLGLYIHFLMSGMIDMEEKKKCIQRNMVDFLENKKAYLYKNKELLREEGIEEIKEFFGEKEELELKEILREILA